MRIFTIDQNFDGKTLREFFELQGFSATQVKRYKFGGKICVNGNVENVNFVLKLGDQVQLLEETHLETPAFASQPANVLWHDNYLYVAEKPFGMAIHPDRAHRNDTLGNCLATFFGQGFELRIVTRLDKTTSGLVLGALDSVTAQKLNTMQQNHQIEKHYTAVVEGLFETSGGQIDLPLLRDDQHNKTLVDERGKPALTFFEVEKNGQHSTLNVIPHTGRTHQIRAHLSAIGHPIVGDTLYGGKSAERIFLHCCRLKFVHPETGQLLNIALPMKQE